MREFERWNPPYPKEREPGWYERSCWAERDWQAALAKFWDGWRGWHDDPIAEQRARATLARAREEYRRRVLGWYRKLCLPMEVGECVPNTVAELLAEEWDESSAPIHLERGEGRAVGEPQTSKERG